MSVLHLTISNAIPDAQPWAKEYNDSGMNAARGILIVALYSLLTWFAFAILLRWLSVSPGTISNVTIGALPFTPGVIICCMWLRDGITGY